MNMQTLSVNAFVNLSDIKLTKDVQLYIINWQILAQNINLIAHVVPEDYQQLAKRIRFKQALYARAALRYLLSQMVHLPSHEIQLAFGEFGKPFCKALRHIRFNVSHSRQYVAVAIVSDADIGVDLEFHKPGRDFETLCKHYFSLTESHYVLQSDDNYIERFYNIWTQKESIMKATGLGIQLKPTTFCTFNKNFILINNNIWHLASLQNVQNISIAVACDQEKTIQCVIVKDDDTNDSITTSL